MTTWQPLSDKHDPFNNQINMKLQTRVTNRILGTADPKFGLMSFPELVASAYYLWDLKDKDKRAAHFFRKLIPVLKDETLKYTWQAILKEMSSCIREVIYGVITPQDLHEMCPYPEVSPHFQQCLNQHNIFEFDSIYFDTDEFYELELKDIPPDDSFSEVTQWIYVGADYVGDRKPRYPKFDFESAEVFFSNFAPTSVYGGEGWQEIVKTAEKLYETDNPSNIMLLFDKLIHIQHYSGNVFNKFKFAPELNNIIRLKAENPKLLVKYLPKGPIRQLAALNGEDVTKISDKVSTLSPEQAIHKWLDVITAFRNQKPHRRPVRLMKQLTKYIARKYLTRKTYKIVEKRLARLVKSKIIKDMTTNAILAAINPVNVKETVDYVNKLLSAKPHYRVPVVIRELFPGINKAYGRILWRGIVPDEVFKKAIRESK